MRLTNQLNCWHLHCVLLWGSRQACWYKFYQILRQKNSLRILGNFLENDPYVLSVAARKGVTVWYHTQIFQVKMITNIFFFKSKNEHNSLNITIFSVWSSQLATLSTKYTCYINTQQAWARLKRSRTPCVSFFKTARTKWVLFWL